MKKLFKSNLKYIIISSLLMSSCNDFDQVNTDPNIVSENQVTLENLLNYSLVESQMDPHISERVFVLYWQIAAHQYGTSTGIAGGNLNESWSSDYYVYLSRWLNGVNRAINIGNKRINENRVVPSYHNNLIQISRIWRAYLLSEMSDNFGSVPINVIEGQNPEYVDVKTTYYHLLSELKDASNKLELDKAKPNTKLDLGYGFDYSKWQKYANSMRLRLAMRLSEVDPAKAKQEFEEAVKLPLITNSSEIFKTQEIDGFNPLRGNLSRPWDSQTLPITMRNLYLGLGGISSQEQLNQNYHSSIKPNNYIGQRYLNHFTQKTNEPLAGYWLDGLPNTIDPRAYQAYIITGDIENPNYSSFPSEKDTKIFSRNLLANNTILKTINAKYTYNAFVSGDWGILGANNQVRDFSGTTPRLSQKFRNDTNQRIFFAPWETYFLIAEANVRGWTTTISGKEAYENGIKSNFEYWGITQYLNKYIASETYNTSGTSVSWTHTAEPSATKTMNYIDGYTNSAGTVNINYSVNTLYKNGSVKNDLLTKIITQKYLAQHPYLPLEAWNDHRRLGLPFFENPAIENLLTNLPDLNNSNYLTSQVGFFPQRLEYPSNFRNASPNGYAQAVKALGGNDKVHTPLWWAKQR